MKILINISPITPPLSGVGRYGYELITRLLKHPQVDDVNAFTINQILDRKKTLQFCQQLNLQTSSSALSSTLSPALQKTSQLKNSLKASVKNHVKNHVKKIPFARNIKQAMQNQLLSKHKTHLKDYIYWEPNYTLSEFEGLAITTIYDLSHVRYPQFHPKNRLKWLDNQLGTSIEKAHKIITISEFSQQEIIDVYGVNKDKIVIVPPAVSEEFFIHHPPSDLETIKQQYRLPQKYILSVGNIEPRKNIMGLLTAYEALPKTLKQQYPLVIIGAKSWLSDDIENKIKQLQQKYQIIRLGYINQVDLPLIYQAANVFVYISLYEGFGMPVAEAMASKLAIICSNCSSMPSVAKQSTLLVNPIDNDEVSETLLNLLEDVAMQQQLAEKAYLASLSYTWQQSTDALFNSFQNIQYSKSY